MSEYRYLISQVVDHLSQNLTEVNANIRNYLTQQAESICEEYQRNGENINFDILIEKLNEIVKQNSTESTTKVNPNETSAANIDWVYVNLYSTYYHDHYDKQLLNNFNKKKIVVNVINDQSSSKSNDKQLVPKKKTVNYSNNIIGSKTMEDLFQVVKKIKSPRSKSMRERVIIIDRYDKNSVISKPIPNEKITWKTFEIQPSTPSSSVSMTPSTSYTQQSWNYYNYPQAKVYTFMPSSFVFGTPYIPNAYSFYPFVYYRY